jgi:hypothetical protein
MEIINEKEVLRLEVLKLELEGLQMLRRRARSHALRAMVIAEREVELESEIFKIGEVAR